MRLYVYLGIVYAARLLMTDSTLMYVPSLLRFPRHIYGTPTESTPNTDPHPQQPRRAQPAVSFPPFLLTSVVRFVRHLSAYSRRRRRRRRRRRVRPIVLRPL